MKFLTRNLKGYKVQMLDTHLDQGVGIAEVEPHEAVAVLDTDSYITEKMCKSKTTLNFLKCL